MKLNSGEIFNRWNNSTLNKCKDYYIVCNGADLAITLYDAINPMALTHDINSKQRIELNWKEVNTDF